MRKYNRMDVNNLQRKFTKLVGKSLQLLKSLTKSDLQKNLLD